MKAMWVLLLVCVAACGGGNHGGVTDATEDYVAEMAPETNTPFDTLDTTNYPDYTYADAAWYRLVGPYGGELKGCGGTILMSRRVR